MEDIKGVWTMKVEKGEAGDLMDAVLEQAREAGSEVLVMDGDMVFGADHVRSAALHAAKAVADGRNASDSFAMEALLYASGERQLSSAIGKMSVSGRTEIVAVAVLTGPYSPGAEWSSLSDRPAATDRERLKRFGVTEKEMSTVAEGALSELVLEKVAAVDIIKR